MVIKMQSLSALWQCTRAWPIVLASSDERQEDGSGRVAFKTRRIVFPLATCVPETSSTLDFHTANPATGFHPPYVDMTPSHPLNQYRIEHVVALEILDK